MPVPSGATNRYRASSLTATHSVNDPVTAWADEAGSDDLAASGAGDDPTYQESFATNNSPCVKFTGFSNDDWLQTAAFSAAISQPLSLVFIGVLDTVDVSADSLLGSNTAGASGVDFSSASFGWTGAAGRSMTAGSPAEDTPYVAVAAFDGASSYLWVNNETLITDDAGANSLDGLTVAALGDGSQEPDARFAEVLVYDRALTSTDLDDLWAYYDATYVKLTTEATFSHGPSYGHSARVEVTEEQFTFTPPTTDGNRWGDPDKMDAANRLMRFYGAVETGKTVYRDTGGVFHEKLSPLDQDLLDATHVYLGGHAHVIGRTERDLLVAAGYSENIE